MTYFKLRSLRKSNPQNSVFIFQSPSCLGQIVITYARLLQRKWAKQLAFLLQQSAKVSFPKQALIHNVEITTTQEIITSKFLFHTWRLLAILFQGRILTFEVQEILYE